MTGVKFYLWLVYYLREGIWLSFWLIMDLFSILLLFYGRGIVFTVGWINFYYYFFTGLIIYCLVYGLTYETGAVVVDEGVVVILVGSDDILYNFLSFIILFYFITYN